MLEYTGINDNKILRFEGGRGLGANRLDQLDTAGGGLATAGTGVGLGLFLVLLLAAGLLIRVLILIGGLLTRSGGVLGGLGGAGSVVVGRVLQVADARFEFVDDAKVIGVLDHSRLSLEVAALDVGGFEVAGAKIGEANAGEIQSEGNREEGHGSGHCKPRLQHGLAERAEALGDAGADGNDFGGGEDWLD